MQRMPLESQWSIWLGCISSPVKEAMTQSTPSRCPPAPSLLRLPARRYVRPASRQNTNIRAALSEGGSPMPPLIPAQAPRMPPKISYGRVLDQVVSSLEEIINVHRDERVLRLTVDFPPERSETRAGTLVSRYENNLNFLGVLAGRLGQDEAACTRLGPDVEIRDNVNPQGGGEYITDDECMVGLRITSSQVLDGRRVSLLLNAGVDASTLKQVKDFDEGDERAVIVLVNCALDRVSWFAKLGFAKYLDSFDTAYYLKAIAPAGWLLKTGSAPWSAFINAPDGTILLEQYDQRPAVMDVEAKIRLYLSEGMAKSGQ